MLVEVMVSALVVALIVVGTFTGFDAVNRTTADERSHDQATLLAAQSQEQLRSDSAALLNSLFEHPHTYEATLGTTKYRITQEAKPLGTSGRASVCHATELSREEIADIGVTSTVRWSRLGNRLPVVASSIVTPPIGSALEVDVTNGEEPLAGVSGVRAVVTYIPAGGTASVTEEAITGVEGCVVFVGIPATTATVEIREKQNFVTPSGAPKVPTRELTIAPNNTTHYPVTYYEGGKLNGIFKYKGSTTYENPETKNVENVTGDSFVAFNEKINQLPDFEVGSSLVAGVPAFEYEAAGEEKYAALTGKYTEKGASTPAAPNYQTGDLFPFSTAWPVYAGDCPKNDVGEAPDPKPPVVQHGATVETEVPMSYVHLNVYTGEKFNPGSLSTTQYPVTITDTACASEATPNNSYAAGNLNRSQFTTTAKGNEGHLEFPFQPFGAATLCIADNSGLRIHREYIVKYTLTKASGLTVNIYLTEPGLIEELVEAAGFLLGNFEGQLEEVRVKKTAGSARC